MACLYIYTNGQNGVMQLPGNGSPASFAFKASCHSDCSYSSRSQSKYIRLMTEAWKMLLYAWMIWLIIVGWSLTAPRSSSSVQLFSSLSSLLGTRQSREDLKMLRRDLNELKWTLPDRICYTRTVLNHIGCQIRQAVMHPHRLGGFEKDSLWNTCPRLDWSTIDRYSF